MPAVDACDVCGRRHADHRCPECGMQLCDAHRDCPECEEELFALSYENHEEN